GADRDVGRGQDRVGGLDGRGRDQRDRGLSTDRLARDVRDQAGDDRRDGRVTLQHRQAGGEGRVCGDRDVGLGQERAGGLDGGGRDQRDRGLSTDRLARDVRDQAGDDRRHGHIARDHRQAGEDGGVGGDRDFGLGQDRAGGLDGRGRDQRDRGLSTDRLARDVRDQAGQDRRDRRVGRHHRQAGEDGGVGGDRDVGRGQDRAGGLDGRGRDQRDRGLSTDRLARDVRDQAGQDRRDGRVTLHHRQAGEDGGVGGDRDVGLGQDRAGGLDGRGRDQRDRGLSTDRLARDVRVPAVQEWAVRRVGRHHRQAGEDGRMRGDRDVGLGQDRAGGLDGRGRDQRDRGLSTDRLARDVRDQAGEDRRHGHIARDHRQAGEDGGVGGDRDVGRGQDRAGGLDGRGRDQRDRGLSTDRLARDVRDQAGDDRRHGHIARDHRQAGEDGGVGGDRAVGRGQDRAGGLDGRGRDQRDRGLSTDRLARDVRDQAGDHRADGRVTLHHRQAGEDGGVGGDRDVGRGEEGAGGLHRRRAHEGHRGLGADRVRGNVRGQAGDDRGDRRVGRHHRQAGEDGRVGGDRDVGLGPDRAGGLRRPRAHEGPRGRSADRVRGNVRDQAGDDRGDRRVTLHHRQAGEDGR